MNYIIKLILIIILFSACTADNSTADIDNTDSTFSGDTVEAEVNTVFTDSINSIEAIKAKYAETTEAINNNITDSASFRFDCKGERSGTVTYHTIKGEIVMIEKHYSAYSHMEATERYFVSDGAPYFIYKKILNWAFDTEAEKQGAVIDKYKEQRFYIIDNELVRCLEKEYSIRSASNDNPDPENILNKTVKCPAIQELNKEFELLLSKQDQRSPIECL